MIKASIMCVKVNQIISHFYKHNIWSYFSPSEIINPTNLSIHKETSQVTHNEARDKCKQIGKRLGEIRSSQDLQIMKILQEDKNVYVMKLIDLII